jgi:hypothetical protein
MNLESQIKEKKATRTLAALIMHEQGHVMAQCHIMWDFMRITTSYSDSSCIHTDDIKHHRLSAEARVISPTYCPLRMPVYKINFCS